MPPKKPNLLPGPKKDSPGISKPQEVKNTNMKSQKEEDPFDEEFDKFVRRYENEIKELEETHKNL
jgi:hypothetical protein